MKMKKKDIIINILCVLWIILVLILKFNGEYVVEPVTDIEGLAEEYYDDCLLEYAIYEYRSELLGDDMEGWVDGQVEKAYLIIMEDGRVYFWNTKKGVNLLIPGETYEDITCSAYYIGQLSSLELWFLKYNCDMVDPYKGYDNGDEPYNEPEMQPMLENGNSSNDILNEQENASIDSYEIRENNNVCILYSESYTYGYFVIESNRVLSKNNKRSRDNNSILILNWLRTTWQYRQYLDLMYQELYPWLVEE